MPDDNKQEDDIVPEDNGGEGKENTVTLSKENYDKLNETLGSLKRELKDLKKEKSEATPKKTKSDEELLKRLDNMALRVAGITAADEVELFNKWKESTGREADDIVGNKIFQSELADLRQAKANAAATDVKGAGGEDSDVRNTPEYWISKATKDSSGELVFPEELPNDINLRAAIFEKLAAGAKGQNRRFYNSPQ